MTRMLVAKVTERYDVGLKRPTEAVRMSGWRYVATGALPVLAALFLAVAVSSCGDSKTSTTGPTVTPNPVSVVVTSTGSSLAIGQTAQLTATLTLSDGSFQNCTTTATWQSSNQVIATVSTAGLVSAVAAGEVDIRATCQGISGGLRLSIASATASLSGTVREQGSDRPLADALVEITAGPDVGKSARTDTSGSFVFKGLAFGSVSARASKPNYASSQDGFDLEKDRVYDFWLTPGYLYLVEPISRYAPPAGGAYAVAVRVEPGDAQWTAVSNRSWVKITSGSPGKGSGTVRYAVDANQSPAEQEATITVSGLSGVYPPAIHYVSQGAGTPPCTAVVSPTTLAAGVQGGTFPVTVTAPANCSWTSASYIPWVSSYPNSGVGSKPVNVYISSSSQVGTRSGSITVAGQPVAVTQSGIDSCTYVLTPLDFSFANSGGQGTVRIDTVSSCPWSVSINVGWARISSWDTSGYGSGTIQFMVEQNFGAARAGQLQFKWWAASAGQDVWIRQAAR